MIEYITAIFIYFKVFINIYIKELLITMKKDEAYASSYPVHHEK